MSITSKSDAAGPAGAGMHRHEEGLQWYAAPFSDLFVDYISAS